MIFNYFKRFFCWLLDLVYPPKCGVCKCFNKNYLCVKCYNNLKAQGKFLVDYYDAKKFYFNSHIYFFKYEGIIRNLILNYKFNEKSYLYRTFINFFIKDNKFFNFIKSYDTIIPVPISKKRFKNRGYNQSYLIAKELVSKLKIYDFESFRNVELVNNNLVKVFDIIEQSKLSKEDREDNIKGVYRLLDKDSLKGKSIILVDDIFTTGSTVKECCRVLREADVKKISVLTIAKDEIK